MVKHNTIFILIAVLLSIAVAHAEPVPEIDCLIEPNVVVKLSSPVSGVLDTITVDRSDEVKKGQVVATINSDVEQVKVSSSKERLKLSIIEHKRASELYREKVITKSEKDQIDNEKKLNELELKQARVNLDLRQIKSPVDGIIVDRYLMPGEFVEDQPILKIAQLDPLRIEVIAPVEHFGKIHKGMHAKIIPEYGADQELIAEIVVVDKVIDAASGTFGVRLELANKGNKVPGGLKCKAQFLSEQQEESLLTTTETVAVTEEIIEVIEPPAEKIVITNQPVTDDTSPASTKACKTIGPVSDQAQLSLFLEDIRSRTNVEIYEQEAPQLSFLVRTPVIESYSEAKQLEEEMKQQGIKDTALMKADKKQVSIALGLFTKESGANKRLAIIERKGFAAEIIPQEMKKTSFTARLENIDNAEQLDNLLNAFNEQSGTHFSLTDCP